MIVVGTVALDDVQTPFGKVTSALGGSATYAGVAASFFCKVKMAAIVGTDFPEKNISFLQRRGIDTTGLVIEKGKTFRWSGKYTYDLNNPQTLKTELNLLTQFKPILPSAYRKEKFVFLANIDPNIQLAVLEQLTQPKLVVADTMNYWIRQEKKALRKVIKKCDILVVNDSEARQYTEEANVLKAGRIL